MTIPAADKAQATAGGASFNWFPASPPALDPDAIFTDITSDDIPFMQPASSVTLTRADGGKVVLFGTALQSFGIGNPMTSAGTHRGYSGTVTAAEFQRSDGTPSARFDSLDAPLSEFVKSVVVGQSANPPRTFYAPHYLNPVARLLSGDDTVSGSDGANILEGYGGADDLHGGGGNDISAFAPGYGADRILDFVAASGRGDRLDFSGFPNLKSVAQVLAHARQEGLDTVFDFGSGDSLTLLNVRKVDLTFDDFVPLTPAANDIDGNRTSDVLWRHEAGYVAAWEMANGRVETERGVASLGPGWQVAEANDFNGNVTSDVLWRHDGGAVVLWEMANGLVALERGLGGFGLGWHIAASGDFNGDRTGDVLWRHEGGSAAVWEMQAGRVGVERGIAGFDANWDIAVAGDFNGDGTSDIVWRHDGGSLALWEMQGGQVAVERGFAGFDNTWHVLGAGDFNGDGTSDILWRHDSGFTVAWEMSGGQLAVERALGSFAPAWDFGGAGDVTGDGTTDILWRHESGVVASWEMQDGTVAVERGLGAFDNAWQIIL